MIVENVCVSVCVRVCVCVCVLGVGEKRKKESPSKSLGGVCRPHRMWLPSGLKYM